MRKTEYLQEQILRLIEEKKNLQNNGRLPTLRQLSCAFGASQVTVLKALRKLCGNGNVITIPGRDGYYAPGSFPQKSVKPVVRQSRNQQIATLLEKEILTGVHEIGRSLPSVKEIRARFGCGYASARSAIELLREKKLIARKGRGYVQAAPMKTPHSRSQICLTGYPDIFWSYQSNMYHLIRAVETDIARMEWGQLNYFISRAPLEEQPPGARQAASAYIFPASFQSLERWKPFFRARSKIPVIIIDPSSSLSPRDFTHPKSFYIFSDNFGAGRKTGLLLRGLGHRKIAYLSDMNLEREWIALRLEGLREAFAISSHCADTSVRVFAPKMENPFSNERLAQIEGYINKARSLAGKLDAISREKAQEDFAGVYNMVSSQKNAVKMQPVFEEALRDESITAWVCVNDAIALAAKRFLEKKGMKIPHELSLCGFDNTTISTRMGLSTYDFGFDRMGHMAIQCILHHESIPAQKSKSFRIEGHVIMRDSVGPPRGSEQKPEARIQRTAERRF